MAILDAEAEVESLLFQVVNEIRFEMAKQGINQRELARRTGLSEQEISRLLSGRRNMTLRSVVSLALHLGCRVEVSLPSIGMSV